MSVVVGWVVYIAVPIPNHRIYPKMFFTSTYPYKNELKVN